MAAKLIETPDPGLTFIAPTALDRFAEFESGKIDPDVYVDELRGERETTGAMWIGREFSTYMRQCWEFHLAGRYNRPASKFRWQCPHPPVAAQSEVTGRIKLLVDGAPVTVSGRVDAIDGTALIDYKTSRLDAAAKDYPSRMQGIAYLLMFPNATEMRWEHFRVSAVGKVVFVKDHETVVTRRYEGMAEDFVASAGRFKAFVESLADEGKLEIVNGRIAKRKKGTHK